MAIKAGALIEKAITVGESLGVSSAIMGEYANHLETVFRCWVRLDRMRGLAENQRRRQEKTNRRSQQQAMASSGGGRRR